MASVSATSSLGNTALRGYGGFASGIDRDSIIEQMTLGTTTKITKQQSAMTKLEWKQEAYQSISGKILDLYDNYFSYASTNSLKSGSVFARNQITTQGKEEYTRLISASGTSKMTDQLSILGVKQLATSSVRKSQSYAGGSLETKLDSLDQDFEYSKLEGTQLRFGQWNSRENAFDNGVTFTLPSTYKDDDGKVHTIDYTADPKNLAEQLNKAIEQSNKSLGDVKLSEAIKFRYDEASDKMFIDDAGKFTDSGYSIQSNSTALSALGFQFSTDADNNPDEDGITLVEYNRSVEMNTKNFSDTYVGRTNAIDYMKGQKATFTFNGSSKEITLITEEEAASLKGMADSGDQMEAFKNNIQARLDKAFGTGKVKAEIDPTDNTLSFSTAKSSDTVSITSNDNNIMKNWGIISGASNKLNMNGTLEDNAGVLGLDPADTDAFPADGNLNLVINGVSIKGLTNRSSINDIVDKINSTSDAGVKATYVDATGQFALVSSETGEGRAISLDSPLAQKLFGQTGADGNYDASLGFTNGQDAIIGVSYGNGLNVTLERSSNTFDLEGLSVTVSGVFNADKYDAATDTWDTSDVSGSVTFSAKADVDGATEAVKKFFEDYNALVTEVNTQVTTRPDSSYGPLTDEQKKEMSEESIKNWETKAKEGILNGDTTLRDLSSDLEGIFLQLLNNGADFEKLKEIGITYSDDAKDGGTLVFDEAAFRAAMEKDPEKVGQIFTGGGDIKKGLSQIVEDTLTPYATKYATRNGNSYGRLIEEAGSEKIPLSAMNNLIYNQLKEMQKNIENLRAQLVTEQDRYIAQFTTMETLISQMNTQSGWLSQLQG
ncbi:MAG: flagellar filament capping protein FliD [Clostridium sp.]|nr:flagellar filament capping protein FliD [Clostridium sp.]